LAELVDTDRALGDALAAVRDAPALAFDTETDAFFAYRPSICLFQMSVPGHDFIVDPLAAIDLAPVGELLADPEREVVLHAAENDVILLQHEFGWRIGRLFDTQVACFVLGLPPYSLAGVLEARFDVKLDKGQQRSDWSRRPLTPKQVAYASDDTHYLLDLAEDLKRRAADAGRTEEIEWECRRIATREWSPEPFDPEGFRRIGGAKELDPTRLRFLKELYLLREREAQRRNRAPYRVAPDSALVKLVQGWGKRPQKGVPEAFWRRYGKRVAGLAQSAKAKGPLPPRKRRRGDAGERPSARAKRTFERLRRWRARAAEERGVETFVVARNELLAKLASTDVGTLDDLAGHLEPFRVREYGEAILAAILESDVPRTHNADGGET